MRNLVALFLVAVLVVSTTACTAPHKNVNGADVSDYGLANEDSVRNPNVQYEPNWWNVFLGIVFCELIIPPIYVFGWHFMKPVGPKNPAPVPTNQPPAAPQK